MPKLSNNNSSGGDAQTSWSGLNRRQLDILRVLAMSPGGRLGDIVEALGLAESRSGLASVSRSLSRLRMRGLVQRAHLPDSGGKICQQLMRKSLGGENRSCEFEHSRTSR